MIKYVVAAIWGAAVASLWWGYIVGEMADGNRIDVLTAAVMASSLTVFGMFGLIALEERGRR
jgi:hypothetical protein